MKKNYLKARTINNMNSKINLEKLRAGICLHFFENLDIKGDLQMNYVVFDSDKKYHTAYGEIGEPKDPIKIIYSMPNTSNDIYMMVTDGNPDDLYGQLASIQQYNEEISHICIDHTIPTENIIMKSAGWSAFLILYPNVKFKNFNYTKNILGKNYRFCLVVPITDKERAFKIEHGIDALLDKFDNENRDIITFQKNEK